MTKTVKIKGVGNVTFPDSMDEKDIVAAIKEKILKVKAEPPKLIAKPKPELPKLELPKSELPKLELPKPKPSDDKIVEAIVKIGEQAVGSREFLKSIDKIIERTAEKAPEFSPEVMEKMAELQKGMAKNIELLTNIVREKDNWQIEIVKRDRDGLISLVDVSRKQEVIN